MTRDSRITPEQRAEESSVEFALLADTGIIIMFIAIGIAGGSLTLMAETIRASLMALIEFFSLVVMWRLHRGDLADLEFGAGKLEQVANMVIGTMMLGGAIWISARAIALVDGQRAEGTPFGLAMAALIGALNLYVNLVAWGRMRAALRSESSLVMRGQLRARTVKLASSFLVQVTMTLAAVSTDDVVVAWADAVGSLFVAGVIVVNALDMLLSSVADLLDRSAGRSVREAIDRAIARHASTCGKLARVRSRRSGQVVFIELALRFDPRLSIAEVNRRIDEFKQSLGREIEHADISVLALESSD